MAYQEIQGNLITLAQAGQFEVIAHGCNCQANMGAGIALQIARHFPKATLIDEPDAKPGTICAVTYANGLTIVNAYTQISPGSANTRYSALSPIKSLCTIHKQTAMPLSVMLCDLSTRSFQVKS